MKITVLPVTDHSLQSRFANLAGEIAESFAFSRTVGQIYGFLYASPRPISLDEIAQGIGISKSNASINLRILEDWGAVKPVWIKGSRRDHYEANLNLKELIASRIKEGLSKRVNKIDTSLKEFEENLKNLSPDSSSDTIVLHKRLEEIKKLAARAQKAITVLSQLEKWL